MHAGILLFHNMDIATLTWDELMESIYWLLLVSL